MPKFLTFENSDNNQKMTVNLDYVVAVNPATTNLGERTRISVHNFGTYFTREKYEDILKRMEN